MGIPLHYGTTEFGIFFTMTFARHSVHILWKEVTIYAASSMDTLLGDLEHRHFQRWKTSIHDIFTPYLLLNLYFCKKYSGKRLPSLEFKVRFLASFLPVMWRRFKFIKNIWEMVTVPTCAHTHQHAHAHRSPGKERVQLLSSTAFG